MDDNEDIEELEQHFESFVIQDDDTNEEFEISELSQEEKIQYLDKTSI